jgi:hypothetical protein
MECPRKYFYQYVLGWQSETPNVHLIFGDAWHAAMETLLNYGYSADAVDLAQLNLERRYREHFAISTDELRFPKVPGFAYEMLKSYARKYADDHAKFEVLYTEVSGSVSVGENSVYFKTDSILRGTDGWWKDKVFSLEHKTASRHDQKWAKQWALKMQIGVYTHLLHCIYPREQVYGVIINASIFQKTRPDHVRVEIPKTIPQMETWLWHCNYWIRQIELEFEMLEMALESDNVLRAFPMNPESCGNYFGCIWHDFCVAWQNPLQHADQVPFGFTTRHWDPREQETTHKMEIK